MSLFISNAYAQSAGGAQQGGGMEMIIMLAVFGLIFYFLLYRPQAKRVKEHKSLMSAMAKGDDKISATEPWRQHPSRVQSPRECVVT